MVQNDWPWARDVVLVGGGHAHALVLRAWGMRPLPGARLTLVSPDAAAPYTGMLPGFVAGTYARDALMIDLVRLADRAGARLILDRAVGIDLGARRLLLRGQAPLGYDVLSLDVGVEGGLPDLPGFAEHAVAARPLGLFAARWQAFVDTATRTPAVVILGGGAGGVEVALAALHRLRIGGRVPQVTVVERGAGLLPGVGAGARGRMVAALQAAGVVVLTGAEAARIDVEAVHLTDGRSLRADLTIVAAGARPQGWLAETGLDLTDGHVTVGPTLQSSHPGVFAAGDCAHLAHAPRPKAGVFAVRAAPVLHANLRAAVSGDRLRRFHPQRDFLRLLSLGDGRAVADWRGLSAGGAAVWRWKDRIDRRFMDLFDALPAMAGRPSPARMAQGLSDLLDARPLCGGCGSKLGAATLGPALAALPPPAHPDVIAGAGDDAAVLRAGNGVQVITTDHLRAVTRDARLMARIAAIHALGDVLAMGALPQVALAQVTLPPMAEPMQADMLAGIMQSASTAFAEAGASVVGGHSTAGAELVIGFAVTGTLPALSALRRKDGARPGDALILTRALGTGVILAALMAQARVPGIILGEAVAGAFAAMTRAPAPAAARLATVARAMTDVTGFGLAGHLLEMLEASGCGAEVDLAAVPLLPGAAACAAIGQASSLMPANRAATLGRIAAPVTPEAALMWDPQTCGGFLAAVPPELAEAVLADLRSIGEPAAQVGRVTPAGTGVTVRVR